MTIFLDTGDIALVERFHAMGIIGGVTTNPTILLQAGHGGGVAALERRMVDMAKLMDPLPLSVEVTSNDADEMLRQAKVYASWAPNINVKIPIHGPEGEEHNLSVIRELEADHDIRVNVTAMMSAQQCLLAAYAGATYVSLFGGRVNNMGYNSIGEIVKLRSLLDRLQLPSKIIMGSTREVLNIVEWLEAGADIVTSTPGLISGMLVHPYSKETVQMFLRDGAAAEAAIKAQP